MMKNYGRGSDVANLKMSSAPYDLALRIMFTVEPSVLICADVTCIPDVDSYLFYLFPS